MNERASEALILTHSLLLGERLYLFARLRFLAAAGILIGALFATYVVGIRGLNLLALGAAAGFLAAYNVGVFFAVRPHRRQGDEKVVHRSLVYVAHLSILLDYLVLTFAIWLVGGGRSPFLAFYLLHAILSSVLLSRRAAFGLATVGYLLLAGLVVGEWAGAIPRHRPVGAVPGGAEGDFAMVLTVLFVYGLLTAVTTVLTTGIVRLLRKNEQGLLEASEQLESLADMRRSFLHVVLHDLRSPVGTVVTMLEGLSGGMDGALGEAAKKRVERAGEKLRGVLDLLRGLRVLADLETERLESLMAPVDMLATVRAAVEDHADAAEQKGQHLQKELPATLPAIRGIERLLREAMANYLTNAIKYADPSGPIVVRAAPVGSFVRIEVSDSGPGIAAEDQGRLFQEFARVGKAGSRRDKATGIGLGLSIVRRIAEAHDGRAGVESQAGQGSTFFIELPVLSPLKG
ncbi:MAG TPA: HAMP domain-containing sensor histidine kinase [Polyangia bacterium]